MLKKKLNKKKLIALLSLIFSFILVVLSTIFIIEWKINSSKTKEIEKEIIEITDIIEIDDTKDVQVIEPNVEPPKENPYWDYIKMKLINVDFTNLMKKNKDVKGWIQVNGTNINYPFVQASDNEFYLKHSLDKSNNRSGWVFMDYRNNATDFDKNTILYAHGNSDKTMFGTLKNITKSNWYENTNNHVIKLSTPTENTLWQVFSIYHIPTTNDYIQTHFLSNKEFLNLALKLQERSYYKFDTTLDETDKILTLSTCWNEEEKVVLHAKLIKKDAR